MTYEQNNEQNLREYASTQQGIYSIPMYVSKKLISQSSYPSDTIPFEDAFGIERLVLMPNGDGTGPRGGGPKDGRGDGIGNQGKGNGGNRGNSGQGPKEGGRNGNC